MFHHVNKFSDLDNTILGETKSSYAHSILKPRHLFCAGQGEAQLHLWGASARTYPKIGYFLINDKSVYEPSLQKINFRKAKPRPSCDASEKLLTQEIISVNDNGKLISSSLKEASEKIVACEGNTEFCTDDSGYPISQIDDLLETNVQQDYFNEVLTGNYEKPACQEKRDKTPGWFLTTGNS